MAKVPLATFPTLGYLDTLLQSRMQPLIDAHANDITVHGLPALRAQVSANAGSALVRDLVQVAADDFDRADGALGTSPTGNVWRGGVGSPAPTIVNGQSVSADGGIKLTLTDIPGLQDKGIVSAYQIISNIGSGDAWLYALFSEPTPSGIVMQRGSDRVRVGTQLGGAITWAQEFMISAPGSGIRERLTLIVDTGLNVASALIDGAVLINRAPLAVVTLGRSVGYRQAGTSTLDHYRVLRGEAV